MTTTIAKLKPLTAADLLAMPDNGKRYELIRGELIEMAPASDDHGFVGSQLSWRIGSHIRERRLGRDRMAETGFQLALDTVLAPDYAFISYERMPARPRPAGYADVIPDLVVEVVSPNDRQPAVDAKIQIWRYAGVRLVLAVYPAAQEIHAHYADGVVHRFGINDTLICESVLPGFTCAVADIFDY